MKPTAYVQLTNKLNWFEEIQNYASDVTTGKKLSSKTEIAACVRFLSDYDKSIIDPDYPYRFDYVNAWKVIAFIELLPHVKAHFASKVGESQLIKLEPWQKFIIANLFGWIKKKMDFAALTLLTLKSLGKTVNLY